MAELWLPLLALSFVLSALPRFSEAVKITRLSLPAAIENGTKDSVVLDCEYNYTDDDKRGLAIKWFLNEDPEPLYQWIPEFGSRFVSPRIRGRINMDYLVSPSSQYTRYRALNLLRPTIDLSGIYTCHVVSMSSQDSLAKMMVVYVPPKKFDFKQIPLAGGGVRLHCEAEGVYPLPQLSLFRLSHEDTDVRLVSAAHTGSYRQPSAGTFQTELIQDIAAADLPPHSPIMFECLLSIPGTDFELQKQIMYYTGDLAQGHRLEASVSLLLIVLPVLHLPGFIT